MVRCVVVTPEATSIEQDADFVVVPLFDGELGIGKGHSPLIGRLGFGELRLRTGNVQDRFYVNGGFVQVESDVVSVMTSRLLPIAELDAAVAEEQIQSAMQRPAHSLELMELRDRAVAQARAQLRMARRTT